MYLIGTCSKKTAYFWRCFKILNFDFRGGRVAAVTTAAECAFYSDQLQPSTWFVYAHLQYGLELFDDSSVGHASSIGDVSAPGAFVFIKLEEGNEQHRYILKQNKAKDLEDAYDYISSYLWHYQVETNLTFKKWQKEVRYVPVHLLQFAYRRGSVCCINGCNCREATPVNGLRVMRMQYFLLSFKVLC